MTTSLSLKHWILAELCNSTDELTTDMGSVLDGNDAVREGLIDELGSLGDAIAALYRMIENQ